jgi:hypothetical protein
MRALAVALIAALSIGILATRSDALIQQIPWGRVGAENLPCEFGAHWSLPPSVLSARIEIGSNDWKMAQAADGSWSVDTGPVTAEDKVTLDYTGITDPGVLTLMACLDEVVPSPSPAPPTQTPPPPGPGPQPSPTPSPSPAPPPAPDNHHEVTVICNHWDRQHAAHLRLVRFTRNGEAIYKCGR